MGRGLLTAAWGVAAGALVLALPGWASAAEGKPPGIFDPQFDLGLWTIIVFVVLLWVLRRYAWGPMLQGLRSREEAIRLAVEEAKLARDETARSRAEFDRKLAEEYAKIPRIMEQARRDSEKLTEEMRGRAQQEIQADRQRLRREIETAKDQALQEIWGQTAQLATLISAKAISRALTPEDHRRLVDEALDELKQNRAQRRGSAGERGPSAP